MLNSRRRAALTLLALDALARSASGWPAAAQDDLRALYAEQVSSLNGTAASVSTAAPRFARPDLVTVEQAARHLGVTARAVQKRISAGHLPAWRYGGRYLLPAAAVREAGRRKNAR